MKTITNQTFDMERALYGSGDICVRDCKFDGPAGGESALKEWSGVTAERCYFNLRYPFWHDHGLKISDCELTELCRAALWYSDRAEIVGTKLHGIKALRECADITVKSCDIISPEFGWSVTNIAMEDCTAESEYFMMRSRGLRFKNVRMKGKYSFQYIEDAVFENCVFDTKDAFWHGKNVTVKDSVVKGEYLGWYSDGLTLQNCRIVGTQPLCYCKNLKLIDCIMEDTDLAFEKSEVEARVKSPIVSVKNPRSGMICAPAVGEIIMDDKNAEGRVITCGDGGTACA